MTFHIRQKVVCVADADYKSNAYEQPRKGRIYTIRWIGIRDHPARGNIECVLVREIQNPKGPCRCEPHLIEPAFAADRFRPITKRKIDISMFKKMLIDAPNDLEHAE